ncbi:MAG: hypothetical protein M3347_11065, partial [Armatimonadota bacterium]|nr:hypothetical protein [Armatimonadota bacterium]
MTRKELGLFVAPLLVLALVFLLMAANNYVISQDEQKRLKPTVFPSGDMIVRRRQPDGSIKEFLRRKNGSETLFFVQPAEKVSRPRGLFSMRNLVLLTVLAVVLSLISLI